MGSPSPLTLPIQLDSPIEFVLIGPFGSERGVLVQSTGATIDLVAHAQRKYIDEHRSRAIPWLNPKSQPLVITSPGVPPDVVSRKADSRPSELTFVWRGVGGAPNLDERFGHELQGCLANHSIDLINALYEGSTSRVTWALAEVVELCRRHETLKHRRRLIHSSVLWLAIAVYAVAGVAVLLTFLE